MLHHWRHFEEPPMRSHTCLLVAQALITVNRTALCLCPCLAAFPTPFRRCLPTTIDACLWWPRCRNRTTICCHTCPYAHASHAFNACSFHRWTVPVKTVGLHWLVLSHHLFSTTTRLEPPFLSNRFTTFVTSLVHITYMLQLEEECEIYDLICFNYNITQ